MDITERRVADALVLSISGDLTLRNGGTMLLSECVRSVLLRGYKHVVLDVGNLRYVDSTGLGELVQTNAAAHNRGATLKLLHMNRKLSDLLALTRLGSIFDYCEHEADAVGSPGASEGDRS